MTYIVHGATGAQGSPVLAALHAAGHPAKAAVRNTAAVEGEAVAVDYSSVESLVEAYRGASGVFLHIPIGSAEYQAEVGTNVAAALKQAQVARVVVSTSGYPVIPGSGLGILSDALQAGDTSYAIVEPKLFLENLLLPPVVAGVRTEGVLRYPVRADYPLSWVSHLDVADVVVALLADTSITGQVTVGALPALLGADLAAGFTSHFGSDVAYESQDPEDFGREIIPMFGEQAARPVVDAYVWRQTQESEIIDESVSAQKLLGLIPRTVAQWLADLRI